MVDIVDPVQVQELVARLNWLHDTMIDVATGRVPIQEKNDEYKHVFAQVDTAIELLQDKGVSISNPNSFKSLWDWYKYWSQHLSTYQARREYVGEIYQNITYALQSSLNKYSPAVHSSEDFSQDVRRRILHANLSTVNSGFPPEIQSSLRNFQRDHPDPTRTAFIMMKFSHTKAHNNILHSIKDTLSQFRIIGVRADDKQYHDDLFPNILTYIYGSGFGIAVFDRIEADEFNPNVSLEVGYMLALNRPVCLLKDKTLQTLHTDLMGKLYLSFDPQDIQTTLTRELSRWLKDKGLA